MLYFEFLCTLVSPYDSDLEARENRANFKIVEGGLH